VGAEANLLVSDPEALARHYIPAGDDVLAHTDVVAPGERFTIYFQVPKAKGRYPYVCTFPGHWMVMNGNLVVE
jgi:azurin